ncbi:DNA-binding protein [Mesorhizobium sp. M5C.F.Cr.IN.023.01.1.1]|nr:DNA-binding protein [Mesorhizobium sp. M5C.F.Cr.IN.023.01.1.1]
MTEAASMLNLSPATVLRQIRAGIIPAQQYCMGAPWVIKRGNIEDSHLIERIKSCSKGPLSSDSDQKTLVFQQRSEMGIMTWDQGQSPRSLSSPPSRSLTTSRSPALLVPSSA